MLPLLSLLLFSITFLATLFISGNALLLLLKPSQEHLPLDLHIPLAIILGLCLIPLCLLWTSTLGWQISSGFALGYVGIALFINLGWLIRRYPLTSLGAISFKTLWQTQGIKNLAGLALIFLLTWLTRFITVNGFLVAPGSDSYHHTLIASLIVEQGQIPTSYEPYAPPTTFTYHFGFHALTAFTHWLTAIPLTKLVLWVGQGLNALTVLSMYFLTKRLTHHTTLALIASFLVGLIAVFPAYFINWSRFTQMSGLVVMILAAGLVLTPNDWLTWRVIPILVAGVFLYHYRIFIMLGLLVGITLIAQIFIEGIPFILKNISQLPKRLGLGWAALLGIVLTTPWLINLVTASRAFEIGSETLEIAGRSDSLRPFFDLNRLGGALDFYSNYWLILLGIIGFISGLFSQRSTTLILGSWMGILLLTSNPYWLSIPGAGLVDINSLVMSFFWPICFFAALGISKILAELGNPQTGLKNGWAWWGGMMGVTLFAFVQMSTLANPEGVYLRANDMAAIEWIKTHTPPEAKFLVNPVTFPWGGGKASIVGNDAGYWLPLLAQRQTSSLPLSILQEKGAAEALAPHFALSQIPLQPDATDLPLLQTEEISHIFIGERGGVLPISFLESSPCFRQVWHKGQTRIYELNYECLK